MVWALVKIIFVIDIQHSIFSIVKYVHEYRVIFLLIGLTIWSYQNFVDFQTPDFGVFKRDLISSRDRREPMSGTRPFPTSRWFFKIMFPVPARFPIFSKITFPIPARFPIFQKSRSRFPPGSRFLKFLVPGSRLFKIFGSRFPPVRDFWKMLVPDSRPVPAGTFPGRCPAFWFPFPSISDWSLGNTDFKL